MSIIIMTETEDVKYSCICKNTEKFRNIEEKFYEKYPKYKESNNVFELKGNKVNVNKSLDYNNIDDNDIILLKTID